MSVLNSPSCSSRLSCRDSLRSRYSRSSLCTGVQASFLRPSASLMVCFSTLVVFLDALPDRDDVLARDCNRFLGDTVDQELLHPVMHVRVVPDDVHDQANQRALGLLGDLRREAHRLTLDPLPLSEHLDHVVDLVRHLRLLFLDAVSQGARRLARRHSLSGWRRACGACLGVNGTYRLLNGCPRRLSRKRAALDARKLDTLSETR